LKLRSVGALGTGSIRARVVAGLGVELDSLLSTFIGWVHRRGVIVP
jgi:hypothetical protein